MFNSVLHLSIGESAVIKKIHDLDATCKLISLGLVPDVIIQVIRKAPLGGALFVKVDHQFLAIRESEAACVEIEIV